MQNLCDALVGSGCGGECLFWGCCWNVSEKYSYLKRQINLWASRLLAYIQTELAITSVTG